MSGAEQEILQTGGIFELSSKVTKEQLGKAGISPKGKTFAQTELGQLGIPIAPTLVLTNKCLHPNGTLTERTDELIREWMAGYDPNCEYQLRTDIALSQTDERLNESGEVRNLPSKQKLTRTTVLTELPGFWTNPENTIVLLQVLPPNSLNRNLFSAQILLDSPNSCIVVELRHDIATTIARENQSPDERITIPLTDLQEKTPEQLVQLITNDVLRKKAQDSVIKGQFAYTLRRFGRAKIKSLLHKKFPRLHKLDFYTKLEKSENLSSDDIMVLKADIDQLHASQSQDFTLYMHTLGLSSEPTNLGEFLEVLGLVELMQTKNDGWHTIKQRLERIKQGSKTYGYLHPTDNMYQELVVQLQKLNEDKSKPLLRGIPKLSILDTHDLSSYSKDFVFVYWDLIHSDTTSGSIPYQVRRELTPRFALVGTIDGEQIYDRTSGQIYKSINDIPDNIITSVDKKWLKSSIKEGD